MGRCAKIRVPRRQLCFGDMRHRITLQSRALGGAKFGINTHTMSFVNVAADIKAAIKTLKAGTTFFDGTNDRALSHEIYIHYVDYPTTTAETWVLFDDRRFDIVVVERIDEDRRFIRLSCNERGTTDNDVNDQ